MQARTRRIYLTVLGLLLGCLIAVHAAAQDQEQNLELGADPARALALRAQLARLPDPSLKGLARRNFWYEQEAAAFTLGDQKQIRRTIDLALADLASDKPGENSFKTSLWFWKGRNGAKRPSQLVDGEALLAELPKNDVFIYALAKAYAHGQDYERAQQLILQAQSQLKPLYANSSDFYKSGVEYEETMAKWVIAYNKGELDEGIQLSERAVALTDARARTFPPERKSSEENYRRNRIWSRLDLAEFLIAARKLDDAARVLGDGEVIASEMGLGGSALGDLVDRRASLAQASGLFGSALRYHEQSASIYANAGMAGNAPRLQGARRAQVTDLIGLGRMDQAATLARRYGASNWPMTLIRVHAGAFADARKTALAALEYDTKRYGEAHYFTQRDQLMVDALEQLQSPNPEKIAGLGQKCAGIASGSDTQRSPTSQLWHNAVLDTCLQAIANSGVRDAATTENSFQIAGPLQDSVVGEILVSAARRSMSAQPEFQRIVGRQDALRAKIDAGFENLAKAQQQDAGGRNIQVMASLRQSLQAQQAELLQLEKELARRFPEFNQLTSPEPIKLTDTARKLARNEILVRILPGARAVHVWAITRDRPALFYTAALGAAEVSAMVSQLRKTLDLGESLGGNLPAYDMRTAFGLYEALLKPARELMNGRSQLIVSAGGALSQLPFGVLLTSNPQATTTPANAPWLIRDFAVSHISSVNAFVALRQSESRAAHNKVFIGFGDPLFALASARATAPGKARNLTMPRSGTGADAQQLQAALLRYGEIPPLPETRGEILAMAMALGADPQKDVVLGARATRAAVLAAPLADHQIIAFATHGLMAGDLPGLKQPALAMAASSNPGESPLLTLEDVLGLKLSADWVVLSACNTAAGDGKAGEALSGLARGFFYAGARALLVTHWAVESVSAQELVTETFRSYAGNKSLSRAAALRQAQLQLVGSKNFNHPFYWAPYALVGEGG